MQADLKNWNIVIVGAWNARIFNPRWISEKLFSDTKLQVQVLVPMIPGFPTVLAAGDIELVPGEDGLTLRAKNTDNGTLEQLELIAVTTLKVLEHTPIRAVGVNFGFVEKSPPVELSALFAFPDDSVLAAQELKSVRDQVSRTFQREEGVLNVILSRSDAGVGVTMNFHRDLDYPSKLENSEEAAAFLEGKVMEYNKAALHILETVYKLEQEKEVAQ